MASCFFAEPRCTISTRSASVSTGESVRMGSATTSTSLASRSATSCGRFVARRRLCDSALRTATSTSFAMIRTTSWAICSSLSVSCGLSISPASLPATSARTEADGSASRRATSACVRDDAMARSLAPNSCGPVNEPGSIGPSASKPFIAASRCRIKLFSCWRGQCHASTVIARSAATRRSRAHPARDCRVAAHSNKKAPLRADWFRRTTRTPRPLAGESLPRT